jgi:tRNA nucleotidyltransferase (CCA-adding enzyme)
MNNINKILDEQKKLIRLDNETINRIKKISLDFKEKMDINLKKLMIIAEVFIGGSLAKDTIVKKDKFDVDIFIRFDKKYNEKIISETLEKILGKKAKKIHGSRDYFQIQIEDINIELIPVIKINKPEEATNVTDLSYFHVKYILDKIQKNKRLPDEIKLAKVFAYSQDCYGAESYIKGFSGYSLELLICHYGSFLEMISNISKSKERIIIDDSKFYRDNKEILKNLNESKIMSPIILIDPTYKDRNALAGLSEETFIKFKESCINFIKNPDHQSFKKKDILEELNKKYSDVLVIIIKNNKQKGDIGGTKSKKFFNFFINQLDKEFNIDKKEFCYNEEKNIAYFFIVIKKKMDELKKGPPINFIENLKKFKKIHPDSYIKNKISYVKIKHDLTFEKFLKNFKINNKKVMDEMGITEIKLK